MNPTEPVRSADPRPGRSRARIIEAATTHLLEHGYALSNLDEIASEAGVAKRTIYNLFAGKEELFRAVVEAATEIAERFSEAVVQHVPEGGDVDAEIRQLAVDHARAVLAPRVVGLRRLLIGEAARFPELAVAYYERAPARVMRALAERFARSGSQGELTVAPGAEQAAAEHFAFLVLGSALDRALFSARMPDPAAVDRAARAGAEVFLRAYRRHP